MNDTGFAGCSKCEGVNTGLKVIFHIKDENGLIFNTSLKNLDLNTKLAYANGYFTRLMLLYPLKEQNPPEQANTLLPGCQLLHY